MKKATYYVVHSWMVDELHLSGNELIVYAIIYGFSQDGESRFSGSRQYLADWSGCTVRSIQNILNNLTDAGYLTKYEYTKNNQKFCEYVANFTPSEKISPVDESDPSEKISLNNIDNIHISNTEDKNIISINRNNTADAVESSKEDDFVSHGYTKEELKEEFLGSLPKKKKQHRVSLYDKCLEEIYLYTKNLALQDALIKYLSIRLAIKDKPIYGVNQWKALLNKLAKLTKSVEDQITIVEFSTEKAWCSFYPLNKAQNFSEGDGLSCEQSTTTAEERAEILEREGKRSRF